MYRFRDFYTLKPTLELAEGTPLPFLFSDSLSLLDDVTKEEGVSLVVTIDATYSGYLLNSRVYPGQFMSDLRSWGTWVSQQHGGVSSYDKPVLTHHDQSHGDPIGRVIDAKYVQLWADNARFQDDYKHPTTDYDKGSGKIVVQAHITDPDAIMKVADGRYKTVSSGQTSADAWCSVCKHNIGKTRKLCEHMPGQTYQVEVEGDEDETVSVSMYLISGYLDYHELSFVNIPGNYNSMVTAIQELQDALRKTETNLKLEPADMVGHTEFSRYAQVTLLDSKGKTTELIRPEGAEDSVPYGRDNVRTSPSISLIDLDVPASIAKGEKENQEGAMDAEIFAEGNVARSMYYPSDPAEGGSKDKVSDRLLYGSYAMFRTITDDAAGHRHVLDLEVNLQTGKVRGYTSMTSDETEEHIHLLEMTVDDLNSLKKGMKGKTGTVHEAEDKHTHNFRLGFGKTAQDHKEFLSLEEILDRIETLEQCVEHTQLSDNQVRWLVPIGDDLKTLENAGVDKKLTGAARKKLKSSTFCGPGRSFPVPDCAHVTAARRLIGRFKSTMDAKAKIMSCVNRKAKSLGCDKDKDAASGGVYALFAQGENMSEETKPKVDAQTPPEEQPGAPNTAQPTTDERVQKELVDKIDKLTEQNSELQSTADQRQAALDARTEELTNMRDELRKTLAQQLVFSRLFTGHADAKEVTSTENFEDLTEEYAKRTIDSLQDAVRDSIPDVQKAAGRLTEGRSEFLFTKDQGDPEGRHGERPESQEPRVGESEEPTNEDLQKI
jgi:hypothetical protein